MTFRQKLQLSRLLRWLSSAILASSKKQKKQTFPSLPVRAQSQILALEVAGLSSFQDQLLTLKAALNSDFGVSYSGPRSFSVVSKKEKKLGSRLP